MDNWRGIQSFIERSGGNYPAWYVGIAANPVDRLTNGHGVNGSTPCCYEEFSSSEYAREVENYFLKLGCQGGGGGGDWQSKSVYAYRITLTTRE